MKSTRMVPHLKQKRSKINRSRQYGGVGGAFENASSECLDLSQAIEHLSEKQ